MVLRLRVIMVFIQSGISFYPVCSGLVAFGYGAYALFPWLHRLRTYHCIIYRLISDRVLT